MISVLVVMGLAAVAQADVIYTAIRNNANPGNGQVQAIDLSTGAPLVGFSTISYSSKTHVTGLAVSPNGQTLYVVGPGSYNTISTYDAATGALLNANFVTGLTYNINGMSVDPATGNIYAANTNKGVTLITPTGSVNENWGTPISGAVYPEGTTVYNGKVYEGLAYATAPVVSYALPDGGSPATVVSGIRADWPMFDGSGNLYTIGSSSSEYFQKWDVANNTHANFGNKTFWTTTGMAAALYNPNDGLLYMVARSATSPTNAGIWKIDPTAATPTYTLVRDLGSTYMWISAATLYAVPEPSTLVLLACGLFGLLAYAWRKRK
jgi:hypothetical protein